MVKAESGERGARSKEQGAGSAERGAWSVEQDEGRRARGVIL